MKKIHLAALAALALAACSKENNTYTLTVDTTADKAGLEAILLNYDNGDTLATTTLQQAVEGNDTIAQATFTGEIATPAWARILIDGNRAGSVILEPGNIKYAQRKASGTQLNDLYTSIDDNLTAVNDSIMGQFAVVRETANEEELEEFITNARALLDSISTSHMLENIDNPIGYILFLEKAYEMEVDKFKEYIAQYPHLADLKRVQKIQESFTNLENTSAGKQYTDFATVTVEGDTTRLSQYVKPGQITIVDFWASWCGPCRAEIENLKELYKQYSGKGLDIVGVAVWEDQDKTQSWLNDNPLPWHIMLNAQSEPTELYGINGIPCVLVIDGNGTILTRDKRGEELDIFVAEQVNALK